MIKKWNFPKFNDWHNNGKNYSEVIGDYKVSVKSTGFYTGSPPSTTYELAISTSSIPTNIYAYKAVHIIKSIVYHNDDKKYKQDIKTWYDKSIELAQTKWEEYLLNEYFTDG